MGESERDGSRLDGRKGTEMREEKGEKKIWCRAGA